MQELGEVGAAPEVNDGSPVSRAVAGLTRRQFLKGVGGAATAVYFLSSVAALAPTAVADEYDCDDDNDDDPTASTGTPEQQEKAKAIVRNSASYKKLAKQQKRLGGRFDWSKAVVKAGCGNVATVQVASNTKKRNLYAAFFANIRTEKVMFHNGSAFTRYGDEKIQVRRLVSSPGAPHPYLIVGEEHVTTADGRRMTHEQFREENERSESQLQEASEQGVAAQAVAAQADCYEDCLIDQYEANEQFDTAFGTGYYAVGTTLLVGGLFTGPAAPAVSTTGAAIDFGCFIVDTFGAPDPETVCADLPYC